MTASTYDMESIYNLLWQKEKYEMLVSDWITQVNMSVDSDRNKKKKILELCQYASFVMSLEKMGLIKNGGQFKILKISEEPDLHVEYNDQLIGLEIKRIISNNGEAIGQQRGILRKAEIMYKEYHPMNNLLVNVSFKDTFKISTDTKEWNRDLCAAEIVRHVHSCFKGEGGKLPSFIDDVHLQNHSSTSFELSGSYFANALTFSDIILHVKSKEAKLDKYKANNPELGIMWLLLVVAGASPESGFYIDLSEQSYLETGFDSVFLLNDFEKQVFKLK